MTDEKIKQFEEIIKPVMKFLCDNFNPHVTIIVTPTGAEIVEGLASIISDEFVRD